MNWFEQNRFLGWFLIGLALGCLGIGYFFLRAKTSADAESARLKRTAAELKRLESLTPFPDESHYQETSAQVDAYKSSLAALQEEIKSRGLPLEPLAPNEFQTKVREAIAATREKARANKVKLPENFFLGADEFAKSLPSAEAAPLLGRELKAIQMLINILIDARVDSISALHREPIAQERAASLIPKSSPRAGRAGGGHAAASPTPAASPTMVEGNALSVTFVASPGAARKALNQIAGAKEQFFIIRTLHVRNEKERGPSRTAPVEAPPLFINPTPNKSAANTAPASAPGPGMGTITFIVGNEHIEVSAQIEIVNFTLAQPERR